jgi:hypothetical protein
MKNVIQFSLEIEDVLQFDNLEAVKKAKLVCFSLKNYKNSKFKVQENKMFMFEEMTNAPLIPSWLVWRRNRM